MSCCCKLKKIYVRDEKFFSEELPLVLGPSPVPSCTCHLVPGAVALAVAIALTSSGLSFMTDPWQTWIFQHRNEQKKYASENIYEQSKGSDIQQTIWQYFIINKPGLIIFIDGTVNTDKSIELLCENFLTFLNSLLEEDTISTVFQQDNSTSYTTKRNYA